MDNQLFPNWKLHLRNALMVAIITFISITGTSAVPSFEKLLTGLWAFVIAIIVEFLHGYKGKPNISKTFFLS